jgi:hypothetical protein
VARSLAEGAVCGFGLAVVARGAQGRSALTSFALALVVTSVGLVVWIVWLYVSRGTVGAGAFPGGGNPPTLELIARSCGEAWRSRGLCAAWALGAVVAVRPRLRRWEGFAFFLPAAVWTPIVELATELPGWVTVSLATETARVLTAGFLVLALRRGIPGGLASLGIHTRPPELDPPTDVSP